MKPDEAKLIAACRKGDQRACKQLYDRYASKMFGLCLRYTRTNSAAEDIMHDGFIKVFANLHTLREADALEGWIRTIMINTALNALRHDNEIAELPDDNHLSDLQITYDENNIIDNIDIEIILEAIRELPNQARIAFNLCELEGYSYADAADKMGLSASSIRSNIRRAKQHLADKLKKIYHK